MTLAPKTGVFSIKDRFAALEARVAELEDRLTLSPEAREALKRHAEHLEAQNKAIKASMPSKYSAGFLNFWVAFPRKIGKGAAWKVWKRDKLDSMCDLIVKSVEEHKVHEDWTKDNGSYIPHPGTFLNQERYHDELEKPIDTGDSDW